MFLDRNMKKLSHSVARLRSRWKLIIISMGLTVSTLSVLHFSILPHATRSYNMPCYLSAEQLDDLRYMVRNIITIYEDMNVTYWLDFGTLLGAVRTGDILRHDGDGDISRMTPEGGTYNASELFKRLSEKGINSDSNTVSYKNLFVDVFQWERYDGEYDGKPAKMLRRKLWKEKLDSLTFLDKVNENSRYHIPASWILPTKKIDFLGMKAGIPNNHEHVLKQLYPFTYYRTFTITIPYKWKCWIPFFH